MKMKSSAYAVVIKQTESFLFVFGYPNEFTHSYVRNEDTVMIKKTINKLWGGGVISNSFLHQ